MKRTLVLFLAMLSLVAISGCGGGGRGGDDGNGAPAPAPTPPVGTTSFPQLLRDEIANTSDTRDPVDVNAVQFDAPLVPDNEDFADLLN